MSSFGYFSLFLAAIFGIVAMFFYCYGLKINNKPKNYFDIANKLRVLQFIFLSISLAILLHSLLYNDFSLEYVSKHSNFNLPLIYKISAVWAGDAGSLITFIYILVLFGLIELFFRKRYDIKSGITFNLIVTIFITFFLGLSLFWANPFAPSTFTPLDGNGMHPMLQNGYVFIHPLLKFASFAAIVVVFSYGVTTLIIKDCSSYWISKSNVWKNWAWLLLTLSIFSGCLWAYSELGWGGFWTWDIVETSTLIIWLFLTAFFHTSLMFEKKGRMKITAFVLIFLTFESVLLSMFITHSGIIPSFHTFDNMAAAEVIFIFMILLFLFFIPLLYARQKYLVRKTFFDIKSRYTLFQIFNVVVYVTVIALLAGMFFPVVSYLLADTVLFIEKVYYLSVMYGFIVATFVVGTLSSFYPISKKEGKNLLKSLYVLFFFMLLLIGIIIYLMVSKLEIALMVSLIVVAICSLFGQYVRYIKRFGFIRSIKNGRFIGEISAHMGFSILCIGVLVSTAYEKHADIVLNIGVPSKVFGYEILASSVVKGYDENYYYNLVDITLSKDGKECKLYPEMRVYNSYDKVVGEVDVSHGFLYDISVAFVTYSAQNIYIFVKVTPFLSVVWAGLILMVLGTLCAMFLKEVN